MTVVVTLPDPVARRVMAEAGAIVSHARKNKTEKYGAQTSRQKTRLQRNQDGFGAEEAVCQWLGIERTQRGIVISDFKPDLVGRIEVRTTRHQSGRLIVHPDDPDDAPFVFVIGQVPTFRLMGWCLGRDAKRPRFWVEPPAVPFQAFFVPSRDLRPIEELRDPSAVRQAPTDWHVCGWGRVDGEWRCVQDHYAVGHRPDTSCGSVLDVVGVMAHNPRLDEYVTGSVLS